MSSDRPSENSGSPAASDNINIAAWSGIGFGTLAAMLYGLLFYMLSRLPVSRNELAELQTNAPAMTRLLIVGASAGLLNVVSLVLCLVGYLLPQRSRVEAIAGGVISALMFLAVFSVVLVSLFLAP